MQLGNYKVGNVYFKNRSSCKINIGRYSYSASGDGAIRILATGANQMLSIGNYCSIGSRLDLIMTGGHRMTATTTFPLRELYLHDNSKTIHKNIEIGNDVWIGNDVTILGGAKIGNGVVIGAKSLITGNQTLEDFGIYGGVPAKLIRYRFGKQAQAKISASKWWNWDISVALQQIDMLEQEQEG